nr:condensation domain-containing protein [Bacillus amyloliquefaciens]MDH3090285.1 condensation domain-containing protein [Bacillus amyloliquefaciens]
MQSEYKELASELADHNLLLIQLDHEAQYDICAENIHPAASPDDTAYIIYTSGTTGTPKGVEVRNHSFTHAALAWRRIYELDRIPVRVMQMASFSFDVFSGDLARALLNGGTLVICPDDVRIEPQQLYQLIDQHNITFMESTPALIVPFMEYIYRQKLALQSVRVLVLGSDMIKAWDFYTLHERFGKDMRIINSYGVTEATIDSSYYEAKMSKKPREDDVPIGVPLPNVQMYVLNKDKQIQPIGIFGELYIGGAGVAKGYWGKPELTEAAFSDPFQTGETLYRTGDQACWLPDGTLRFQGRIDKQVKIRGYRIETGEIESVLLKHDHVKEAAVTVMKDAEGQGRLAAYIVPKEADISSLRQSLMQELPAYMMPSHIIGLDSMPLTLNGKLDKSALPAGEIHSAQAFAEPADEKQAMLCRIWEDVLHIQKAGIHHSFFELGGDSIKALQVSARLAGEGWNMSIRDLFQFPTIAELAKHLTPAVTMADQGPIEGSAPLTPIQQRFFEEPGAFDLHYNQSVMLCSEEKFQINALHQTVCALTEHHDALRMTFTENEHGEVVQYNRGITQQHEEKQIAAEEKEIQQAMRLDQGPLVHLGVFRQKEADHLLITIHHLIVDGVSWRILLEDLQTAYQQALEGKQIKLPPKSDSYIKYAEELFDISKSKALLEEAAYWDSVMSFETAPLPKMNDEHAGRMQENARTAAWILSSGLTKQLLSETQQAYGTDVHELLLTALGMALQDWTGSEQTLISTEGHGRQGHIPDIDISRTAGWFTSLYPVLLDMRVPDGSGEKTAHRIKTVKDMMRRVPHNGTGFGLLRYSRNILYKDPEISFNYLGAFDGLEGKLKMSPFKPQHDIAAGRIREFDLDINAMVAEGRLEVRAVYTGVFAPGAVESFMNRFQTHLEDIIAHCSGRKDREKTLTDYSHKELTAQALSSIEDLVKGL